MCAAFRSTVHLLLRVVDYIVCVFVAKCICITEVMLGGKTVSRGVLVDVAVP